MWNSAVILLGSESWGRRESSRKRLKSEFMKVETQTRRMSKDSCFCPFCFIRFSTSFKCVSSAPWPFDALILLFCCSGSSSSLSSSSFMCFFRPSFLKCHLSLSVSSALNFLSSPPFSVSDQSNVVQFYQSNCRNHGNSLNRQLGRLELLQVYPTKTSWESTKVDLVKQQNICVWEDLRPAGLVETTSF